MNAKISFFVICVETIMYWLLYNLHDCTFNVFFTLKHYKQLGVGKTIHEKCHHSVIEGTSNFNVPPSSTFLQENLGL